MSRSARYPSFLLVPTAAAIFVALSSRSLPPVVASHFVAGGPADGFMPRSAYVAFMLLLTVGLPLFLAVVSFAVRLIPPQRINLPNRDYWLAPERSAATLDFLQWHGTVFGMLLAAFLCFVHWLVVQANAAQPPLFPEGLFFPGLLAFFAGVAVWLGVLVVRFRHRP